MSDDLKEDLKRKATGMASAQKCSARDTVYGKALVCIMKLEIEIARLRTENDRLQCDLMRHR